MKNYKEIIAWGLTISIVASVGLVITILLASLGIFTLANFSNVASLVTAAIGLAILFFIAGTFANDWNYEDHDE
jgi:threonine/homoserine/homoserine lactone efflux protein